MNWKHDVEGSYRPDHEHAKQLAVYDFCQRGNVGYE